ncbi:hypothetical protein, partial [Enterococcus faecium]|uniref:hypothetical protein n=1 Tax=Enterococcus faecium TaxID=1352 RepID=UPI003CC57F97
TELGPKDQPVQIINPASPTPTPTTYEKSEIHAQTPQHPQQQQTTQEHTRTQLQTTQHQQTATQQHTTQPQESRPEEQSSVAQE